MVDRGETVSLRVIGIIVLMVFVVQKIGERLHIISAGTYVIPAAVVFAISAWANVRAALMHKAYNERVSKERRSPPVVKVPLHELGETARESAVQESNLNGDV